MPKNETKILVIILLLIDIVAIGAFLFMYSYTKSMIADSVSKEVDIKSELKKDYARTLMKDDYVSAKSYESKLSRFMIQSGGTVNFIKTLEQLVLVTGLRSNIRDVSNVAYPQGDSINIELLSVNINLIGEWKNIQYFLAALENYPLKINIKSVNISKLSDYNVNGKVVPQWSANFEFTVLKLMDTK